MRNLLIFTLEDEGGGGCDKIRRVTRPGVEGSPQLLPHPGNARVMREMAVRGGGGGERGGAHTDLFIVDESYLFILNIKVIIYSPF